MTPKEKAKELFDKYCWAIRIDETDSGYFSNVLYAKECALIAVDELIDQCWGYREIDLGLALEYWEEVKQEIESYEL
jgi:hypothetical protein